MEVHFTGKKITKTIEELSRCEVFVYGTDMKGNRVGRAERLACEKFGAMPGQKSGPQGQCYAIPIDTENPKAMIPYVADFIDYVMEHPDNRFLITRMGCGTGKIDSRDKLLAPLFREIFRLPNTVFSREWLVILIDNEPLPERPDAPEVVNEDILMDLCRQYRYQISANYVTSLPSIQVRYVIDKGKFGYAQFGDFFFQGMSMYVFPRRGAVKQDEEIEDDSARGCAIDFLHDECWNRPCPRKVIFAGVQTPFTDSNGESIYTGDVIKVDDGFSEDYLAVGAMCDEKGNGNYGFILDNHTWHLEDCAKHHQMTRVGTVFYQLKEDDFPTVNQRTAGEKGFIRQYDTKEDKQQKVLMAKFTPNFYQEFWKYEALEMIGAEFNWRK